MKKKLIINDFKKNKLVTLATVIFMAISATMLGISVLLSASLLTSIDRLMSRAQTPDFLQMHAGDIDENQLTTFANDSTSVESFQIVKFLNLENGQLELAGHRLLENTQDNGLCTQNTEFDYLLDMGGGIITVGQGEVYVPVCYKSEYDVKAGDCFKIGSEELVVAGFLRDSQMNSMMASSKRFLVSESDYDRLACLGEEEYLIEFMMVDGADVNSFATEYSAAGLPANGPTITYSLVKMMNALSDGTMIFVILLVSIVILLISILCIRYILLTSLEKDRREIGMMKAIGISSADIRKLYMTKFYILSSIGGIIGAVAAVVCSVPLGNQMRELYGMPENMAPIYVISVIGIVFVEAVIILSVRRTLRGMRKLSAVTALRDEGKGTGKRKKYLLISVIAAFATALMIIPQNIASTLESPKFVPYMGIGESQIRIDIRQTEDILKTLEELNQKLASDKRVKDFASMNTSAYQAELEEGSVYKLLIERGDHSTYPVRYSKGTYPSDANDLAISKLIADELGLGIGDMIKVGDRRLVICGIYSDITNGGKTAKACFEDKSTPAMWSVVYLNLTDESLTYSWISEYECEGTSITDIAGYVQATYGQTISNISNAAVLTIITAAIVLFVVVILFLRLIIWQERGDCSLKKALGIRTNEIRFSYTKKLFVYVLAGVVTGVLLGVFAGEALAGMMIGALGATEFKFIISPVMVLIVVPLIVMAVGMLAARIGLLEIKNVRAYECCVGRE